MSKSILTAIAFAFSCTFPLAAQVKAPPSPPPSAPALTFAQPERNATLGMAYNAALQNVLVLNTIPYTTGNKQREYNQTGLLSPSPDTFLRAGAGYEQPWTRDASVNSWNAASLLEPAVARNTLLAVLQRQPSDKLIVQQDNQWWDQVIWITAAWNHFLLTGDRVFLAQAYEAAGQTLERERQNHFNAHLGLYQGPAFLNDGIAGYPVPPADPGESRGSFVLAYPGADQIMVLSTNCLYVQAFRSAALMALALGRPAAEGAALRASADTLAQHLRERFWIPEKGRFGYLLDPAGKLDPSQEGAGLAFAILFGIATPEQTASILKATHIDPHGLVDVYPPLPRYSPEHPGRHNEIVWPPIQAFWAEAAARAGDTAAFQHETETLADLVVHGDGHLWEIYNATTGAPDGGWQVGHQWDSQPDQTWSATGYLRMIYAGLFGMRPDETRLTLAPTLPQGWGPVTLSGLPYRHCLLTIELRGAGNVVQSVTLDGAPQTSPEIPSTLQGRHVLRIELRAGR